MVRTPGRDKSGMKKGTWTPEEDQKLIDYVTRYGCWNWRQLPKFAGLSRCGKSCRLRWLNYLRPDIKRGNFTPQEEDTIIKLHQSLGNRWSAIASHLPGRTDNEIKNQWHTTLKKRLMVAGENNQIISSPEQQNPNSSTMDQESGNSAVLDRDKSEANNFLQLETAFDQDYDQFISCNFWGSTDPFLDQDTAFTDLTQEAGRTSSKDKLDREVGVADDQPANFLFIDPVDSTFSARTSTTDQHAEVDELEAIFGETYRSSSGDFWTEPFLSDPNYYSCTIQSNLFLDSCFFEQFLY